MILPFYKIPFTPREVAMGGTGVASSSGAFSQFWNPANIIKNVGKSVSTFRKGGSGYWKNFFNTNIEKKFVSHLPGPLEKVTKK